MRRALRFTPAAAEHLQQLESNPAARGTWKQVLKTLGLLELDPRHPGLRTHECDSIVGAQGGRVWEAYAQTPGAYRVFFHYGPDEMHGKKRTPVLTIVAITPHP